MFSTVIIAQITNLCKVKIIFALAIYYNRCEVVIQILNLIFKSLTLSSFYFIIIKVDIDYQF